MHTLLTCQASDLVSCSWICRSARANANAMARDKDAAWALGIRMGAKIHKEL